MSARAGQAAYNDLYMSDPETANAITGTDADPFYDDSRLPAFYARVQELEAERYARAGAALPDAEYLQRLRTK